MKLNKLHFTFFSLCFLFLFFTKDVRGRQFFAAINGQMNNPGTFTQPWALDTALRMPSSSVTGGDTIWIRGGVYKGFYNSTSSGTVLKPLVIQAYPGERVILDSYTGINNNVVTLTMNGNYVWLVDIEIGNSSPNRTSNGSSIGNATDIHQATGINVFGIACKIINCAVHDCPGTGIGYWSTALDAEVYGSFIYYNGLSALDRGHGPAFYAQNSDGLKPKAIRNCFIFSGFSTGIQFYSSATSKKLQGLIIDSSTIFNLGALTRNTQARRSNIVVGAEVDTDITDTSANATRVDALYVHANVLYRDTTDNMTSNRWHQNDYRNNTELGYKDELVTDKFFSFRNNHLYGDPLPIMVHQWDSGVFKKNFIYSYRANATGNRDILEMVNGSTPFSNWDSNTYHINQPSYTIPFSGKSFAAWKADYGIDSNSSFVNSAPADNFVYIRRNKYQSNSFYVTVMNYQQLDSVLLNEDFSAFMGMSFGVFDVQLSTTKPVFARDYTGQPINMPLNLTAVAATAGTTPADPRHTSKTLGTFVLTFYPKEKTIKSGNWNDPTVWDTGRVPTHFDDVELRHPVTVSNYAWCRSLKTNNNQVSINTGAYLLISNTGN